jgi:hypothetical protein
MKRCSKGLGSARVSRAGDGVLAIAEFSVKIVSVRHRNQHARSEPDWRCVRYPAMPSL